MAAAAKPATETNAYFSEIASRRRYNFMDYLHTWWQSILAEILCRTAGEQS